MTSAIDDALWRIDPRTNRVVARIPLAAVPRAVAVGAGGVWVTTTKPAPPAPKRAIKIGVYADCQGIWGFAHNDSLAGAELPLVERGGRLGVEPSDGVSGVSVGGRPIRLYFGCDATDGGSSTAQTLAEARRLVEQVGVDILIAPTEHARGAGAPAVRPDAPARRPSSTARARRPIRTRPRTSSSSTRTPPSGWPASAPTPTTHSAGAER